MNELPTTAAPVNHLGTHLIDWLRSQRYTDTQIVDLIRLELDAGEQQRDRWSDGEEKRLELCRGFGLPSDAVPFGG